MLGYKLRYQSELRNEMEYFRDIKEAETSEDSLELAEALILKNGHV